MLSHNNLANIFQTNFAMVQHHKYSFSEIENMHGLGDNWLKLIGRPAPPREDGKESSYRARVMTIDIGGGTTDGIIFKSGKPFKVFTINIGGKLMTNDLALGLGLPTDQAEKIKKLLLIMMN